MEGGVSSVKSRVWPNNDVIDMVFSWSLEDIFNDDLYTYQVEKIPDTFCSWKHYLGCYTFPLLVEVREVLASSMDAMGKAPFAEVISFEETKGHGNGFHYNVKVEFWKRRVSAEGEQYKTMPGDLVVISDNNPEAVSDLNRAGWNWSFALVVNVTDDDDDGNSSTCFKVKMPTDFGSKIGAHATIHIVFLENFTTTKRIWSALGMTKNLNIIESVLYTSDEVGDIVGLLIFEFEFNLTSYQSISSSLSHVIPVEKECDVCSPHDEIGSSTEKIDDGLLAMLNESQANAVLTCLERSASLVFCTSSSSFWMHSVEMEPFSLLVIDEAAQMRECESIIALQLPGLQHAVLVGDECQLPAIVHSKYRMHPAISRFPNSSFYHNQLLDAPNVQCKTYEREYLQGRMFGPYSFINVPSGKEESDDIGHSRRNMVEVALVMKIVQKLFKIWRNTGTKLSIGVISPYAAQVIAIRDKIGRRYDNLNGFAIKVKSVDGFQGGEEDIIILSTVRSNRAGTIGFMSSLQRTNVALTRARHCLWIMGNERTLVDSDSVWKALVLDAKKRKCIFSAGDDSDLSRTILDVKKELDQFDDLLNADSILFKNQRWNMLLLAIGIPFLS
ncbi:unnamed protein product [Cuscuta campestris]|uniref:Uncharacterized protein n=1 Tax=Cuscuta campestris TaxID=132261 RepID=A0A484NDI8_9ASTE|nr:unnamed protein product [Cuscuta campestris]